MADDGSSSLRASAIADFFMHKMSLQVYRKKNKNVQQKPQISEPWPAPESSDHELENSAARSTIGKSVLVRDHQLLQRRQQPNSEYARRDANSDAASAGTSYNPQGPAASAAHSSARVAAQQEVPLSHQPLPQLRTGGGGGGSYGPPAAAEERHIVYKDGRMNNNNNSSSGRKLGSHNNNNKNYTDDDASLLSVKVRVLETLVANIFESLASLRSTYSRVQSAAATTTTTHDNNNVVVVVGELTAFYAADRSMVAHLNHLSRLQHSYVERNAIVSGGGGIVSGNSTTSDSDDDEAAPTIGSPTAVGTSACSSLVNTSTDVQTAPSIDERYSYRGGGGGGHHPLPTTKDALLKSYEGLIQNLQVEVRKKNAEVESLKDWLAESTLVKEKLEKKVRRLEEQQQQMETTTTSRHNNNSTNYKRGGGGHGHTAAAAAAAMLVEGAVQSAWEACSSFTNLFMSLIRAAAEWDVEAAFFCRSIEDGVSFAHPSDRRFAFESYVSQHMWHGFESADFYVEGDAISSALITTSAEAEEDVVDAAEAHRRRCWEEYAAMVGVDAVDLITTAISNNIAHHHPQKKKKKKEEMEDQPHPPHPRMLQLFAKFCQKKFLALLHPKMETIFFGNSEHRRHIVEGKHPNSQLYHAFLRLAKAVWLVHRLAFACHPAPPPIFQAHRAMPFSPRYMHSVSVDVVPPAQQQQHLHSTTRRQVVAFSITPGFLIATDIVIKCQVYLQQPN